MSIIARSPLTPLRWSRGFGHVALRRLIKECGYHLVLGERRTPHRDPSRPYFADAWRLGGASGAELVAGVYGATPEDALRRLAVALGIVSSPARGAGAR